jgi:hypothetical protein
VGIAAQFSFTNVLAFLRLRSWTARAINSFPVPVSASNSEVFHPATPGAQFEPESTGNRLDGADPGHTSYRSFATFRDPDGNRWLLQEVTTRLPGRVAGDTTYGSVADLSQALQRAAAAHGWHESRTGKADPNWPDWYAEYLVREQSGEDLPR